MKKISSLLVTALIVMPYLAGATEPNDVIVPPVNATTKTVTLTSQTVPAATPTNVSLFNITPKKGTSNSDVTTLQTILASDPTVYPQGAVTGYYGNATETAVKNLQKKYDLPVTGVIDQATQAVLMPDISRVKITVTTPNGGEDWNTGEKRQITGKNGVNPLIYYPTTQPITDTPGGGTPVPMNSVANPTAVSGNASAAVLPTVTAKGSVSSSQRATTGESGTNANSDWRYQPPVSSYISIDLIRDNDASFVYHIANAGMYQPTYAWYIPKDVQSGTDYRIRITTIGNTTRCGGEVTIQSTDKTSSSNERCLATTNVYYPGLTDTSDNTFTINASTATSHVFLSSVSPDRGSIGTTITITGSGFTPNENKIYFNDSLAGAANSSVGATSLTFAVPESITPYCPPGALCKMSMELVSPGTYSVSVKNAIGTSNRLSFTVTDKSVSCPWYTPTGPDFCKGGTIVPATTVNGCTPPPTCKMPTDTLSMQGQITKIKAAIQKLQAQLAALLKQAN